MRNSRVTVLLLGVALVLVFGAGLGSAAGVGSDAGGSKPTPTRDHGRGVWYERACGEVASGARCDAQVVSDAGGTPTATGSPPAAALSPARLHAAYNLPTTASATRTIAIVDAYDDPKIESDLAVYNAYYGLPPCTTANGCFKKVNQTGGTFYPISNPSWALEIALDVETAHAICQNCKILLVEASSNANANLYLAVNEAVKLGADAISNSWSSNEYATETSDDNTYFNHPGVAITASSGDSGYGVQYPAASRYVIGVGGTTLTAGAGDSYSETAWSGAGSGCSVYEPKPLWQTDTGCPRRTVADVSADADPNTGAAIYDSVSYFGQSGWFQVGGTSLASPLVASVFALAGSSGPASVLYSHQSLLTDIASGSNGSCSPPYLCTGVVGYDGPTGLGSPNGLGAFSAGPLVPDFALSASPSSQTVAPGGSADYAISVNTSGGFAGSVSLSATGLPAGATASFNPSATTGSSTLTVSTLASLAPGSYPFTISGTSGALSHTAPATLVVQTAPAGDFALSVTPPSQTVAPGTGTNYTVSVSPSGGFAASVSLSATGLPAGATGSFNPSTTTGLSTLTVSTSSGVAAGSYPFTVTGTSGILTHTASATLTVQAAGTLGPGDFSLTASPASLTVPSGFKSVVYTITIARGTGFYGSISLSTGSLPPTFRATFGPNPAVSMAKLTLTGTGGGSTPSTITITGVGNGRSHTATVTLIH